VAVTTHGVNLVELQAEIFIEEGADPARIVIGHLDDKTALDLERDKRLGRLGFNLGYDHIGIVPEWSPMYYAMPDEERADLVMAMIEAGFIDQMIVACDTNAWSVGLVQRGTPESTFAHLIRGWIPLLRSRGLSDSQVETLVIRNPARILPY
jgi:phosphotriesterase-related protein